MKKIIKRSFIGWLVFWFTALVVWVWYAAISTVTSWSTLTSTMWNEVIWNINNMSWDYTYSTSEVDTWKKWIDGKPIYRKVYQFSDYYETLTSPWVATSTPSYAISIDISSLNIDSKVDFIFNWSTWINWASTDQWVNRFINDFHYDWSNQIKRIFQFFYVNGELKVNTTYWLKDAYAIIEYTKTTD